MTAAKDIAFVSIFTALLLGGQVVLSGVGGVEIVTVLLLSFSFFFGIKRSIFAVNAFSILRCFIFGFFVNILLLYLVYYNLFVLVFGLIGNKFKHTLTTERHIFIIVMSVIMTALFSVIDDIITPLYSGLNFEATKAYWLASLPFAIPQMVCAFITVLLLLPVLVKTYSVIFRSKQI